MIEAEFVTVRTGLDIGGGGDVGGGVGAGSGFPTTVVVSVALLLAAAGSTTGLVTLTVSVWTPPAVLAGTV